MKSAFAEPEVITRKGKPVSVIVPIKEYEALLERLEDAEDLAYLNEARTRPLSFRPLKEYLAERKKSPCLRSSLNALRRRTCAAVRRCA